MSQRRMSRNCPSYLPYWEMDYTFPRWDLLTTVAWFGVGLDPSGQVAEWHGWGGDETEALVQEAHANGVRAVVTVTLFSDELIGQLLDSSTAQATAIETCLSLVAMHDADGVNIDFETVPYGSKQAFVTFMNDLKDAVDEAMPDGRQSHVTLAGPAVDWDGAYDFDQLLIHTDGIMVMAYDYHWAGGNPGPVSPLSQGDIWGKHTVTWTIDDYLTWGGVENRHRLYLGLPLYGRAFTGVKQPANMGGPPGSTQKAPYPVGFGFF